MVLSATTTAALFGEDQARYLLAVDPAEIAALLAAAQTAGVPAAVAGHFGGDRVSLGAASAPLVDLSALYRSAFARAVT